MHCVSAPGLRARTRLLRQTRAAQRATRIGLASLALIAWKAFRKCEGGHRLNPDEVRDGHQRYSDHDDQERAGDKIGEGHQSQTTNEWDDSSLPFAVHKEAHSDRAEQQSPQKPRLVQRTALLCNSALLICCGRGSSALRLKATGRCAHPARLGVYGSRPAEGRSKQGPIRRRQRPECLRAALSSSSAWSRRCSVAMYSRCDRSITLSSACDF